MRRNSMQDMETKKNIGKGLRSVTKRQYSRGMDWDWCNVLGNVAKDVVF